MLIKKIVKSIDWIVVLIFLTLFVIGLIALYSANGGIQGDMEEVTKHLTWFRNRYYYNYFFNGIRL